MNCKMIVAVTIGSVFEIFDFLSFVFLSSIIAQLFFPKEIPSLAIVLTYVTISVSYLLRPIGGIILANIGDKYGRKSVFTLSVLLMSIPSLIVGILPTFHQIGYLATILMILARILQGFSVGGEVPGSITYIAEYFKHKNVYFYCAFLTFGANIGVVIAALLINFLNKHTTHEFMYTYGWRIPFLLGSLLTILGFYIRKSLKESQSFKILQQHKQISKVPFFTLLAKYKPQVIMGILLCLVVSVMTSVFHVFLPNLFITYFKINIHTATNLTTVGAFVMAVGSLQMGYCTKYINPITIIQTALCGLAVVLIFLSIQIINLNHIITHYVYLLYLFQIIISILLSGVNGIFFGLLPQLFDTQVRFSGVSVSFNVAYLLGAGLTPLWTSLILHNTHNYHYIMIICLFVVILSFINTIFLKYSLRI